MIYDLRLLKEKQHLARFIGVNQGLFESIVGIPEDWQRSCCAFWDELLSAEARGRAPDFEHLKGARASLGLFGVDRIPKKNKRRGFREVVVASDKVSDSYKSLARKLSIFFAEALSGFPHKHSFGYHKDRSTRQNAAVHVGAKFIVKLDIENFFGSITRHRVKELFASLGVADEVADSLSRFLAVGGPLPLGLATSPIVSNAIFHDLDMSLGEIASRCGLQYSRYVDDITFSSTEDIDLKIIDSVSDLLKTRGFRLANDKTRWKKRGQSLYVTGLSISAPDTPHCPRRMKRDLRQILYYSQKFGLVNHAAKIGIKSRREVQKYVNRVDGIVKYVCFHEPTKARSIKDCWRAVLSESSYKPWFEFRERFSSEICMVFDEAEFESDSKKYLAVCVSVSAEQEDISREIGKAIDAVVADPFYYEDKEKLRKRGMHFGDLPEDLRRSFLDMTALLPFRAYIAFSDVEKDEYEKTYLDLIASVLRRRLIGAHSRSIRVLFEQNSKISMSKLEKLVQSMWADVGRETGVGPSEIFFGIVDKKFMPVGVPDFILGAFVRYYAPKTKPIPRNDSQFELIRDKIRVIYDLGSGREYGRRDPILRPETT